MDCFTAPKKRKLKFTAAQFRLHETRLPSAQMYERSYMHRADVTHSLVTQTHFLVTASKDGYIKFWKKIPGSIEFVKQWKAHLGNDRNVVVHRQRVSLSSDHRHEREFRRFPAGYSVVRQADQDL